jgi:hypothetical protein
MTPVRRVVKRMVIILVYITIASAIGTAFYFLFRAKPNCTDGKKNQGEENIDCGGPCPKCEILPQIENLVVSEKNIIQAGASKYDALVKIQNPNSLFGAANFEYSFDFFDENGQLIGKKEGASFALPAETKYIFAFNTTEEKEPQRLDFRIKTVKWQKFLEYEEPDIPVFQKEFDLISSGSGFAELKAKIRNRSNYNFKRITTRAVLRDLQGKPVAVNETNNNDVTTNEEREIIFRWNDPFSKDIDVQRIEVDAEVNVFDDENFMRKYGSPDQYESYDINGR